MIKVKGWNIPDNAIVVNGLVEWYDAEDNTFWQVDPVSGKGRHKGDGPGCFWTDWE